jgi:hypothetical protein
MNNVVAFSGNSNIRSAMDSVLAAQGLYFNVATEKLRTDSGKVLRDHKAIVNHDSREVISVMGKDYKVVTNEEIFTKFNAALAKSNLNLDGVRIDAKTSHERARAVVRYTFPAHSFKVSEKDENLMQLVVMNSYDGSCAFKSFVGAFRLVCANGMVIGQNFASHYGRHTSGLDISFAADKLRVAAEVFANQKAEWERMTTTEITEEQAIKVISEVTVGEKLRDQLLNQYRIETMLLGETQWALFNALTYWSTHQKVAGEAAKNTASIILNREESVRKAMPVLLKMAA